MIEEETQVTEKVKVKDRRLRHTLRKEDQTTINFRGFELTFKHPTVRQLAGLSKYSDMTEEELKKANITAVEIERIMETYVQLFVPSELDTRQDFKNYLNELPYDLQGELVQLISEEVFGSHQKKVPDGLKSSSMPSKENT